MGMGSSGGGGGSSGSVAWPGYFQAVHHEWLNEDDTVSASQCAVDQLNNAFASNPYLGASAYNPSTELDYMDTQITGIVALADALNPASDWVTYLEIIKGALVANLYSEQEMANAEDAYNINLDTDFLGVTLPRFQRGMQDVNAVMSSAFVVGRALLEADNSKRKTAFSADLRLQNYKEKVQHVMSGTDSLIRLLQLEYDFKRTVVTTAVEERRVKIVAMKEAVEQDLRIDENAGKWGLEIWTYGFNFLASAHGASTTTGINKATTVQSAIGGAMSGMASGAMMGTMISPGYGTVIGAGLGGILGALK
jgi:hypothetical protein